MVEICSVVAIVGLIALLSWADLSSIARRMRKKTQMGAEQALVSAVQENAVLIGRPISIKTGYREITFFPDGRIDEKREEE